VLPLASNLYELYQPQGVWVLGLSTVFEDFSLNTEGNTRKLIEEGYLVGETARYFQRKGIERYEEPIPFPVAMDAVDPEGIGQIFAKNHFRGTPTWVLFDSGFEVDVTWFRHKDRQEVMRLIDGILKQSAVNPIR